MDDTSAVLRYPLLFGSSVAKICGVVAFVPDEFNCVAVIGTADCAPVTPFAGVVTGTPEGVVIGTPEGVSAGVVLGLVIPGEVELFAVDVDEFGFTIGLDVGFGLGFELGFAVGVAEGFGIAVVLGFTIGLEFGLGFGLELGFGTGALPVFVVGELFG